MVLDRVVQFHEIIPAPVGANYQCCLPGGVTLCDGAASSVSSYPLVLTGIAAI